MMVHSPGITQILDVLGWSLFHFIWQGAIVWVLLATLLGVLRNASSQVRYAFACGGLLLMVLTPVVTGVYLFQSLRSVEPSTQFVTSAASSASVLWEQSTYPWWEQVVVGLEKRMPLMVLLWCLGVLLLCCRLGSGLWMVQRLKRFPGAAIPVEIQACFRNLLKMAAIFHPVRLVCSTTVQVPAVLGWLRPVVCLPMGALAGMSMEQVEALLLHELMHIRRNDYVVNLLQSLVEILLFYHPAVWWVSSRIRQEREYCCDDAVLRICKDKLIYAKALASLEERRSALPVVALGSNGGVLLMRIKRILGYKDIPSFSHLSVFLPAVLAALLASSLYLAAQSSSTDQQTTLLKEESALPPLYRQWLEQDVRWIISPEERAAYLRLPDNNERDQFIKQFWERRNPESGSSENKVREEHYRRIAYANVHFASLNTLGSMSDRGRIYISWGKPISIDSHPSGTAGSREAFEVWHYDSIRIKSGARVIQGEGLKENTETKRDVDLLFVDDCSCGNYRLKSELPM